MEREVYKELRAELLNVSYQAGDKRVKELTIKHKRKILLFLNTSSGRGNALEIWNRAKKIFGTQR